MSNSSEDVIDPLSMAVLDTTSAYIDWNAAAGEHEDPDREARWWDTQERDITTHDGTEHTVTLVCDRFGGIMAVFLTDGARIDVHAREDYLFEHSDDDGQPLPESLSMDDLDTLFSQEIEMPASPAMNYWYPLQTSAGAYSASVCAGGGDEIDAAYRLHGISLLVVEVDEDFGLVLAGGGMDMTWHIVRAFIALGYYPPTYFCKSPGFYDSDAHYLLGIMRRSLELRVEQMQRAIGHIDDERRRIAARSD